MSVSDHWAVTSSSPFLREGTLNSYSALRCVGGLLRVFMKRVRDQERGSGGSTSMFPKVYTIIESDLSPLQIFNGKQHCTF